MPNNVLTILPMFAYMLTAGLLILAAAVWATNVFERSEDDE